MFTPTQLAASVIAVLVAACACSLVVFARGIHRRVAYGVLCVCASLAIVSWVRFGDFHSIYVDRTQGDLRRNRPKAEHHQPLHFHEFFHYYLGSKYFREVGYLGLYDCTVLADHEMGDESHSGARIGVKYVRDLGDVLQDKTYADAMEHCRAENRPRFSDARWASFKDDIRELERLVPDDWWNEAVYDAGFNPPPSWVLVGSTFSNIIPIRAGRVPTYLLATSLDMMLLLGCFYALRSAFGRTAAVVAAIFLGASFIASYGWNGGAFLRYTWISALVISFAAMKHGRWVLAGALLAASACDRVFPAGFALGAIVPIAYRALRSTEHRRVLLRLGAGFGGTVVVLFIASAIIFGFSSWTTFFSRILRHGDVYYVSHIGLKKLLTFRSWVPQQNFHGHEGLMRFHDWNVHLRETWSEQRPVALLVQAIAFAAALATSVKRRPYEAAVLCGVVFMFVFSLPANYYYVVLALVPALLLRGAATAPAPMRRLREYGGLVAFLVFWTFTFLAPFVWNDDIVYDFWICLGLLLFLVAWTAAWLDPRLLQSLVPRRAATAQS
jgi:hypothetical protein